MRDFFERQEAARKKTRFLVLMFFIATCLTVLGVYAVVSFVTVISTVDRSLGLHAEFWDWRRLAVTAFCTIGVIMAGTIYKISSLNAGGRVVAELLGGRIVNRDTADLSEKRLLNIVEEMAIASGLPVPDAYVLDRETGINAFAAGFGINDAVICVTRGALKILTRDEMQGVVAHEFSHILNADVLINMRLMGILHGILLISMIGAGILRGTRYSRAKNAPALLLAGLLLYLLGIIGLFFGKVIKSAIARQREYLADASAVQFTRNPSGIGGALKKIGGMAFGSILMHPKAAEASHMFISNGVASSGLFDIMSTHPPLIARIRRIDPRFDGRFPKAAAPPDEETYRPPKKEPDLSKGIITGAVAAAILETVGAPVREHSEAVAKLIKEIPEPLFAASRSAEGAVALVCAMLMDGKKEIKDEQIKIISGAFGPARAEETLRLAALLPSLDQRARLPLLDMLVPSLRRLAPKDYASFKNTVEGLIAADRKLGFFEFIMKKVLILRLDAHFNGPHIRPTQIYRVRGAIYECSVILSAFAHIGNRDSSEAEAAFVHASRALVERNEGFYFLPKGECTFGKIDEALRTLETAGPVVKRRLLAACLECLKFDKTATVAEIEMFRGITEALGFPVPPWLTYAEETKEKR